MKVIRIIFTIVVIAIAAAVVLNRDNVHSLLPERYNLLERLQKMISEPSEGVENEGIESEADALELDLEPLDNTTPTNDTHAGVVDSAELQLPTENVDSIARDTVTK